MKITDLRCAMIGRYPVVRIVTDEGLSGYSQIEFWKPFVRPQVLMLRELILGMDPCEVERVMLRIRHRGAFKPWGAAVSAVEIALWDLAGKAAGLPIHRLLGGKIRDRVRVYNGGVRFPMQGWTPEGCADQMRQMLAAPEGFTIVKQHLAFHSPMPREIPGFHYGEPNLRPMPGLRDSGLLTERGMAHVLDCVSAMKEVTGDRVGLALDCGPGWVLADAKRIARALEPLNLLWLEDLLTGDQSPHVDAAAYRELTLSTTTPIHTGEQIYLARNFRELIETRAVSVIGPDPCDIGGLAELKRAAEHAELYGIQIAPHGVADGLLGLAALVQVSATLPQNYIAFELPDTGPDWWRDIVEGLPGPLVKDGFIEVWDRPGLGVELIPEAALAHMAPEDAGFFDQPGTRQV